ncbi:hypothetical protein [Streptomyces canus]|uniref:hypothetical protein n=1 Tax=Streptomyces canus TaxID=58343 RepID=UPI00035C5184|nr:hypothetical protein [Streptomyces canus]
MTHEHAPTHGHLTEGQKTRIEFARRDLEDARAQDLGRLDAAGLILLVERMRGRLGDILDLVNEVTAD